MYNRDKCLYNITVGITFRTDKKIPVKFLEIVFKKNKQKHYPLIISRNLHILMKCSFIDICVIIIFKKKSNFPVTARDLIFYWKHTTVRSCHRRCSVEKGVLKNSANFTGKHLCGVSIKMILLNLDSNIKPNYCTWYPDWTNVTFKWFVMNHFGNPSKWTGSNIFL